jgi:hypothetical protein
MINDQLVGHEKWTDRNRPGLQEEDPEIYFKIFNAKLIFRLMFTETRCIFGAYVMSFVGCSSIYMLCATSFERLYIIHEPTKLKKIDTKAYIVVIVASLVNKYTTFWI